MQEWQNKLMGVTTENVLKHPEGLQIKAPAV